MQAFTKLNGLVAPMDRANVDTDAIIPKQFLKSIKRTGYGPFLFDEWRYEDHGEPGMDCTNRPKRADFVLNKQRYQGAEILLARENFGCGSSREHAPWAILDFGFSCVIAPSFADIFFNNCFKNGILPIVLDDLVMDQLFKACVKHEGYRLDVDLEQQTVTTPGGESFHFEVDTFRKHCLLNGLDDIALTLTQTDVICSYENERRKSASWLF
ncbi:MAG: 3-isopropylmalate dehydratase small subunit [Mariprofundus sp.]|nr:3-isopropylmalate dehydratase small subunit [Mariprofundus sp.]